MPEAVPFLSLIICQFPVPLSSILVLVLCLGTDIIPAISYAFEEAELDIMTRKPRNKFEHMVTARLVTFSYGQIGLMESFAAFFAYFVIMNDYGFLPMQLFGMATAYGYAANPGDM